jgi:hypothetical protein
MPPLRDLSSVATYKPPPEIGGADWAGCLQFTCQKENCDNGEPTNFDGPKPPCCVHILRDMSREFDRIMLHLGLEYVPAYGMLLGLTRADQLIPWTSDNDVLVESRAFTTMAELWKSTQHLDHGLGFLFEIIPRVCVKPNFAGGSLQKWRLNQTVPYSVNMPFMDVYKFTYDEKQEHVQDKYCGCYYNVSDVFPLHRKPIYNGAFDVYFPNNADAMLSYAYGSTWRVPDPRKGAIGGTSCVYKNKKERLIGRAMGVAEDAMLGIRFTIRSSHNS